MSPTPLEKMPLRKLLPLYLAQALATGSSTVSMSLASLIISSMGREELSGLPSTLIQLSAACSAGTFGAFMLRSGRRMGLLSAFILGALGALVGFFGIRQHTFITFLLGTVMMGAAQGGYQQARYAAAESVPKSKRGTALGALMLMSVAGSLMMTGFSRPIETLGKVLSVTAETAGWLIGAGLMALAAIAITFWKPLRPPDALGSRLNPREALRMPGVRHTALTLATGQGVMVTLMSLTPLRAHHMGVDHMGVAGLISGHILGMFGFGWLTGPGVDRFGLVAGYRVGSFLLLAATLTALLPGAPWLAISMFLLGLGWNLINVTGSKALSETPAVQGVADSLSYIAAGGGTLAGGVIITSAGFPVLTGICAVFSLLPLFIASTVERRNTKR